WTINLFGTDTVSQRLLYARIADGHYVLADVVSYVDRIFVLAATCRYLFRCSRSHRRHSRHVHEPGRRRHARVAAIDRPFCRADAGLLQQPHSRARWLDVGRALGADPLGIDGAGHSHEPVARHARSRLAW